MLDIEGGKTTGAIAWVRGCHGERIEIDGNSHTIRCFPTKETRAAQVERASKRSRPNAIYMTLDIQYTAKWSLYCHKYYTIRTISPTKYLRTNSAWLACNPARFSSASRSDSWLGFWIDLEFPSGTICKLKK